MVNLFSAPSKISASSTSDRSDLVRLPSLVTVTLLPHSQSMPSLVTSFLSVLSKTKTQNSLNALTGSSGIHICESVQRSLGFEVLVFYSFHFSPSNPNWSGTAGGWSGLSLRSPPPSSGWTRCWRSQESYFHLCFFPIGGMFLLYPSSRMISLHPFSSDLSLQLVTWSQLLSIFRVGARIHSQDWHLSLEKISLSLSPKFHVLLWNRHLGNIFLLKLPPSKGCGGGWFPAFQHWHLQFWFSGQTWQGTLICVFLWHIWNCHYAL